MDKNFFSKIARTFTGLLLIIFGVNFFNNFLGIVFPEGDAASFMNALYETGYFIPMLAVSQIAIGLCLVANVFVPFALLMLIPISVNIILFNFFVAPVNLTLSIALLVSHIFLIYLYIGYYKHLFK